MNKRDPNERKQVIVIRKDLNMRRGKQIAQGAHASLAAILHNGKLRNHPDVDAWLEGRFTKVCVSVDSEQELIDIHEYAKAQGLLTSLIRDAGLTEFGGVPTLTAVAVGPGQPEHVDKVTGKLKLL